MAPRSNADPIFVLGCQRSGTTLLCAILNRHTELFVANELPWVSYDYLDGSNSNLDELASLLAPDQSMPALAERLTAHQRPSAFDILEIALTERSGLLGKTRWGIKDPRLTYYLPLMMRVYPGAKCILLIRDCRATAASIIRMKEHIANVYHAAGLWRDEIAMQAHLLELFPDHIHVLRYEEFVNDPRAHVEAVCGFLGLDFQASMLDENRAIPIKMTLGSANVANPITMAGIDRWKEQLTGKQIGIIEYLAGDQLRRLGYDIVGQPRRPGLLERTWYRLQQLVLINYWWQKRRRLHKLFARACSPSC